MLLSLKALSLSDRTIHVWQKAAAPPELQSLDLSNEGKLVWVVPTKLQKHVQVQSLYSQKIRGGMAYIS